jgi:hypothetical protein
MAVRPRPGRAVAVLLLVVGVLAGGGVLYAQLEPPKKPEFYAVGFSMDDLRDRQDLERARDQRRFRATVLEGFCAGSKAAPAQRLDRIEVRRSSRAVTAWVRMREDVRQEGACFGVGSDFETTVALPEPVGQRALVIYDGPYDLRKIVIPPRGRAAARDLVLPIRNDRRQPPRLAYSGAACDAVARYLRDVPRQSWCANG